MGNYRLLQRFTLRAPLSHIGESIGTDSTLVEEPILQPNGAVSNVFSYSGNAWRGQLRDLMASYLLDHLGSPTIALDTFHLLYSGGAIGGPQQTNLAQARAYRRALPPLALLGGGIGNQILPGKLRVSNLYPWCVEAPPALGLTPAGPPPAYRALTIEKQFSRKDDAKDERLNQALASTALALDEPAPKRAGAPAQQMRVRVELVIAGTSLLGHIDALDVTEIELGCLVAALHVWSRSPHLGGQASRGHGLATLETALLDLDSGATVAPFLTVADRCLLAPAAKAAKAAYDTHLRELYDALLAAEGGEIRALIGAV